MRKRIWILVMLLCFVASFALAEDAGNQTAGSEILYTATVKSYTLPVYGGEDVEVPLMLSLSLGESGEAVFTVPEDGLYEIWLSYKNVTQTTLPTEMNVTIDGAMPFAELQRVKLNSLWVDDGVFPLDRYGNEIATTPAAADIVSEAGMCDSTGRTADPFLFELTAGDHTLSLRINAERVTPVYETIDVLLDEINALSNDIQSLMGGAAADPYRSYHMLDNFPDLVERLNGWADECEAQVNYIKQFSPNNSGSAFSNLTLSADQLRRLAEEPEELPRRLSEFSTGANSAARMLAQQLTDMAANDLSIDQIYIYQQNAELPAKANFLESAAKSVERFFRSFTSQDYAAGNGEEGHLQVWMGRSRQYVETVQNMIDTEFTPETGIQVDISLMPDANKLVLANAAGTAPDVVLSLQYVIPSYLNIRGALYDLTQFEDFPEVAQRFSTGLFVPYILGNGVYAMPETVNFWVMFYRKDILDNLQIAVPNSMDEVKLILPELQRRSMNFYFPTAGMVGTKVFPGTLPLILQAGGSIYDKTVGDTTLDSEISLEGFREMTELFTVYNMPTDVPSPGFY